MKIYNKKVKGENVTISKKEFNMLAECYNTLFEMLKDYMIWEHYNINDTKESELNELIIDEVMTKYENNIINLKKVHKLMQKTNIIPQKIDIGTETVTQFIDQYYVDKVIETGLYDAFYYFKQ